MNDRRGDHDLDAMLGSFPAQAGFALCAPRGAEVNCAFAECLAYLMLIAREAADQTPYAEIRNGMLLLALEFSNRALECAL